MNPLFSDRISGLWAMALACVLALHAVLASPISAQTEEPAISFPETSDVPDETFQAPVIVDGHELFVLRGSSALPAIERVTHVQQRIVEIAAASKSKSVEIAFEETDLGIQILADGTEVTLVTEADAQLDQMDMSVLASLQGDAIRDAILSYRNERTDGRSPRHRRDRSRDVDGWICLVFSPDHLAAPTVQTGHQRHCAA